VSAPLFYLGSHHATTRWWELRVPLFVSVRVLSKRVRLPEPRTAWALDSGAFSELAQHGRFVTTADEYAAEVERLRAGMPHLQWVAPQDWMCEPFILAETGLTVSEHQARTVGNFLDLRDRLGPLVIPVIQGYGPAEYDRCVSLYQDAGVDLQAERVVGVGSVCRRSGTSEARRLLRYLSQHGLRMHGFGLKGTTFLALRDLLTSADSMAWSAAARREGRDSNSPIEAMQWRKRMLAATL
jgi:hypothetical protein